MAEGSAEGSATKPVTAEPFPQAHHAEPQRGGQRLECGSAYPIVCLGEDGGMRRKLVATGDALPGEPEVPVSWTAWRTILAFGAVSLAGDMVYEGLRSVSGPLLAGLGASAVVVGVVTGVGEGSALLLRLVFGPLSDRSGHHWRLALVGYSMTRCASRCLP